MNHGLNEMMKANAGGSVAGENPSVLGHILVVDDDEIFALTAGRILREAGYAVQVAGTFGVALDVLESSQPLDLMITDLVMKVNGIALARMARMRRKGLKVIYVTGYDIPPGADKQTVGPILRKPVQEDRLVNEVAQVLAA